MMEGFDLTQLSYGALFVWLLVTTTNKNEERELRGAERERKLQDTLEKVIPTLEKMNDRLDSIEETIEAKKAQE